MELLKSERFNNRLLCEIISHEKFRELLADAEIYVDGIATMHFHDTNSSLAALRAMILEEHPEATADRAIKVLEACQVGEEDFFCHVTHKTWDTILHDIRKAHENDSESAPDTTPALWTRNVWWKPCRRRTRWLPLLVTEPMMRQLSEQPTSVCQWVTARA